MTKKPRVPKTADERCRDCETHLYFLWDARRLYARQPDRFKQMAAELRVLVCKTKTNDPLLLDLMDELGFSYDVAPPGPPFDKQPIPMVGWRDDPIHQQLTAEVQASLGDEERMAAVLEKQASLRRAVPFREYVDNALAVYIAPYDYSYRELTLAVAQQLGSGHEDPLMDVPLAQMRSVVIGNDQGHIAPLIPFSDLVIQVGSAFLGFLAERRGFEPKYFARRHA